MSKDSSAVRPNVARQFQLFRLPLWMPTLLLIIGAALGLVFSLGSDTLGKPYVIVFGIFAVCATLFVNPRGLVLAAAQIPLMYTIFTPLMAWFMATYSGTATSATPTKTRVITAAYPIVQFFPWLVAILVACIIVAIWRYLEFTRLHSKAEISERKEAARRKKQAERSSESATTARRRLAESDVRTARQRRSTTRRHTATNASPDMRPASEIIADAERRRLQRREQFENERKRAQQELFVQRPAQRRVDDYSEPRRVEPRQVDVRSEPRLWGESSNDSRQQRRFDHHEGRPATSRAGSPRPAAPRHEEWPPRYERPRRSPQGSQGAQGSHDNPDRPERRTWHYR